jgi:hypothetical protein
MGSRRRSAATTWAGDRNRTTEPRAHTALGRSSSLHPKTLQKEFV